MDELMKKVLKKELGVEDEIVLIKFEELIQIAILDFISKGLGEEEVERFLDLAEDNEEGALNFLRARIPNFDQELVRIAREEIKNVRKRN